MPFSVDRFYRLNRRLIIWVALFALLWMLRDFFGLIFLTFVLCFISAPVSRFLQSRLRLPRALSVVAVYALFLICVVLFVWHVPPRVAKEAGTLLGNLDPIKVSIIENKNKFIDRYPSFEPILADFLRSQVEKAQAKADAEGRGTAAALPPVETVPAMTADEDPFADQHVRDSDIALRDFLDQQHKLIPYQAADISRVVWKASTTLMMALLFSFLISMDISRLSRELKSLRASRLHDFYEEAAQPVVRFGFVVGQAMQAQAIIACVNTLLTLIGLLVLQLPSIAMLSLIVFLCSFIPVLGVFISTIPIVLVALNSGGLAVAGVVIVMVVLIHAIEAYLLNPIIYGQHLKLNPVLVLMILFVGHHAFGVWGMLLGIPVAYYLIHDVFGVQLRSARRSWFEQAPPPSAEEAIPDDVPGDAPGDAR